MWEIFSDFENMLKKSDFFQSIIHGHSNLEKNKFQSKKVHTHANIVTQESIYPVILSLKKSPPRGFPGSRKSLRPVIFRCKKTLRPVIFFIKKSLRPVIFSVQKSTRPAVS